MSQNTNSSAKRRGFPDKRGVRSSRQMRTVVFQTDTDCGLTDKLGLRFTDRHRLDFPDTCHLDFPDALHLNFPDASYLTKRPKSGITRCATCKQLCSSHLAIFRVVVLPTLKTPKMVIFSNLQVAHTAFL